MAKKKLDIPDEVHEWLESLHRSDLSALRRQIKDAYVTSWIQRQREKNRGTKRWLKNVAIKERAISMAEGSFPKGTVVISLDHKWNNNLRRGSVFPLLTAIVSGFRPYHSVTEATTWENGEVYYESNSDWVLDLVENGIRDERFICMSGYCDDRKIVLPLSYDEVEYVRMDVPEDINFILDEIADWMTGAAGTKFDGEDLKDVESLKRSLEEQLKKIQGGKDEGKTS